MASLRVESSILLNFWFESIGIPVNDGLNGILPLFVSLLIGAVQAIAVRSAALSESKAVAIEFQAPAFFAVASSRAC